MVTPKKHLKFLPINNQFPDNRFVSLKKYSEKRLAGLYTHTEINKIIRSLAEEVCGLHHQSIIPDSYLLNTGELIRWYKSVERLSLGEPLAYVTEKAWFYQYPFKVNRSVLIPRPETEELTELVLKSCSEENKTSPHILDIGTGSGCIAITLKKLMPNAVVCAIDISEPALEVARENARRLQAEITFIQGDIKTYAFKEEPFDLLVSNPPYIPLSEKPTIPASVTKYEPAVALFTNQHPLEFYETIFNLSEKILIKGGKMFLECHQKYAQDVLVLSKKYHFIKDRFILKDLSGNERFFICKVE